MEATALRRAPAPSQDGAARVTAKLKIHRCSSWREKGQAAQSHLVPWLARQAEAGRGWAGVLTHRGQPGEHLHPGWVLPRVGEQIGTGASGICPPPSASPGILQISPLSQPLAAYK